MADRQGKRENWDIWMKNYEDRKGKIRQCDRHLHFHVGCNLQLIIEVEYSRGLIFPLSVEGLDAILSFVFTSFLGKYTCSLLVCTSLLKVEHFFGI